MSPRKKDSEKKTEGQWVTRVVTVTPEFAASVIENGCAWTGCKRSVFATTLTLPAGWKHIVVASGSLFEQENLMAADVDGVLCPDHYKELLGFLAIGPLRLKQMEEDKG